MEAAITCGLYGWMLHTRYFADFDVAQREYEDMKAALAQFVSLVPLAAAPHVRANSAVLVRAISAFVERFP